MPPGCEAASLVMLIILDLIDCNLSGSDWLQIALALIGCLVDGPSR